MNRLVWLCLFLWFANFSIAQRNVSLLAQLRYDDELNDIWGWVAPDGAEYALVGVTTGVSIVSLANPSEPKEVAFVPGAYSVWRDLKTFGHFAYVTADQPGTTEGLLVIDLSPLPDSVTYKKYRPSIFDWGTLNTCHNLYIDESGFCYLAGCNVNSGGMVILDVASDPGNPELLTNAPAIYSHDVFVQDDRMFASEIYEGRIAVYDVSDKDHITLLGSKETPFTFTHNAWASPDGQYVFTTDERENAPVAAFDLSNLNEIRKLDEFRPQATLNKGVIPHNVHVYENWLVISYYTDGAVIVDATRPENLIEVGQYDTYPGPDGGFAGSWGAFPFFPSGIVLATDITEGLFVLKPDYIRACYLEGRVSDATNGQPLSGVQVSILSGEPNSALSDLTGQYQTGQAQAGIFQASFFKSGYQKKTVDINLQNGEITLLDVELTPEATFRISGKTIRTGINQAVPQASVVLQNENYTFEALSDNNGNFSLGQVYSGIYDIFTGAWGSLNKKIGGLTVDQNSTLTLALEEGYQDDFIFDLGWETSGNAQSGAWVRGRPIETRYFDQIANPGTDIDGDLGSSCYMTGNRGGGAGNDDVDNGITRLTSPVMDLSTYENPLLSYSLWFFNNGGTPPANDSLTVWIFNGRDSALLETVRTSQGAWRQRSEFYLAEYIELTGQMRVVFETGDLAQTPHVVEAAVDAFLVSESTASPVRDRADLPLQWSTYPNPFSEVLTVDYQLEEEPSSARIHVFNLLGQRLETIPVYARTGRLPLGKTWYPGVYFIQMESDGKRGTPLKVVKR